MHISKIFRVKPVRGGMFLMRMHRADFYITPEILQQVERDAAQRGYCPVYIPVNPELPHEPPNLLLACEVFHISLN